MGQLPFHLDLTAYRSTIRAIQRNGLEEKSHFSGPRAGNINSSIDGD